MILRSYASPWWTALTLRVCVCVCVVNDVKQPKLINTVFPAGTTPVEMKLNIRTIWETC